MSVPQATIYITDYLDGVERDGKQYRYLVEVVDRKTGEALATLPWVTGYRLERAATDGGHGRLSIDFAGVDVRVDYRGHEGPA